MSNEFASLYVADGAGTESVTGTAAKMTTFASEGARSDESGSVAVVPVVASDKITVLGGGQYFVAFTLSGTLSVAGDVEASVRMAGVEQAGLKCRANFAASSADQSMSCSGFVEPAATGDIEIYLEGTVATLTVVHSSLTATRVD